MILKTGTYVGTGVAKSVPTGNEPDFVIVKAVTTTVGDIAKAIAKTSTMSADAVKELDGNATGMVTGRITALTATGFDVGTDAQANKSGVTYEFLAIEQESGDLEFEVGSYNGNGVDNRNISLTTMTGTPGVLMIFTEYTVGGFWVSNVHSVDRSQWFDSTAATVTNGIQSIGAGTFQVGTRDQVNRGTGTPLYHYVAIREIASKFEVATFTGNNTDDRTLTGAGFQPTWAMVQNRDTVGGASMAIRGSGAVGDLSSLVSAVVDAANIIQAFTADGVQVGTSANVNSNLIPYTALYFNADAFTPPAGGSGGSLLLLGVG